jgi:hypothetical protein
MDSRIIKKKFYTFQDLLFQVMIMLFTSGSQIFLLVPLLAPSIVGQSWIDFEIILF